MSINLNSTVWSMTETLFESYDSIFVILGSVMLLLFFSKLKIQSRWINSLATSAFAIYLIHMDPFVFPYFKSTALAIKDAVGVGLWFPSMILYCIAIYLACYILDRPRYYIWRALSKRF